MSDPCDLSTRQAGALLRNGSLSAVELTESTLQRIERSEPALHAYVHVLAEEALAAARQGDLAAYLASDGFTGATRILEGDQGLAVGMSSDADPPKLVEGLGEKWAVPETSFKFHASCRHTHPAADALLEAMGEHGLGADQIAGVRARVHGAAIDVLGPVRDPRTIHQSKFSMGFVLAMIATTGSAGIDDFTEEALEDPALRRFSERVEMIFDP